MQNKLKSYIAEHKLLSKGDKLAIAISGGIDSVCAAHLFEELQIPFSLVHCNFKLRGEESDLDEEFIKQLQKQLTYCTAVYSTSFDTKTYATQHKQSTQEAARELRYTYFSELYNQGKFQKLVTAHHSNDQIETLLINLYRKSGIRGLSGMPQERDFIIRPLLNFTRNEIQEYVSIKNIKFREDSSNESNVYLRNQIRNTIIPKISKELPEFEKRALASIHILQEENELFDFLVSEVVTKVAEYQANGLGLRIQKTALLSYPQASIILYQILNTYGFNMPQCKSMCSDKNPGNQYHSNTHTVTSHQDLLLVNLRALKEQDAIWIESEGEYVLNGLTFTIQKTDKTSFNTNPNQETVSIPLSWFPLQLRYWQEGDRIKPLGMQGSKLMSDFFIDRKIDVFSKNNKPLLVSNKNVLWVTGMQISEDINACQNHQLWNLEAIFEN